MAEDPSSSPSASLTSLYTHLQTLIKKWVYGKTEVDNKLSNKLDKAQTSYKGKNVIVDSSSGNIAFEDKNNHTHSQYLTEHQSLANYVLNSSLGSVAFSNDYDDLDNLPSLGHLAYENDATNYVGAVALSNDYDDLDNKPTIPTASSTTPGADTTNGSIGADTTWARSDHTHPKSNLYAESTHAHSDADITTLGFYSNLPQANYGNPSQQQVNFAINSAMGNKEDNANKVTSLSGSSTDTQYPSAKAVYDATFNLDTLDCINENFTILSLPQIIFTHDGNPFDGSTVHILEGYDKGAYVDWGDGTPIETYESTDTLEHSYSDSVREHIITIYGDILNLYNNSFENFIRMTSINIPSGVTSLGDYCFNGCTGLTNVVIPSSVISLGGNCFSGCTNLVDYQLYWERPPVNWSSTRMPNNTDTYFTIPNGTTANYTAKGFPSDKLVERSE